MLTMELEVPLMTGFCLVLEQFVSIRGYVSKKLAMKHGVPKDCVLGPLLF